MQGARLYLDYVDPGSFLVERTVAALAPELDLAVERVPFEATPPPRPLVEVGDASWRSFWDGATRMAAEQGVALARPRLVPWTRKAHELALHAREHGCFEAVHAALFDAFLLEGRDLGRVDVLLELAAAHGLDRSATKAVLDVDRHAPAVLDARADAERAGVRGVPTLLVGRAKLEGFRGRDVTLAFLRGARAP